MTNRYVSVTLAAVDAEIRLMVAEEAPPLPEFVLKRLAEIANVGR